MKVTIPENLYDIKLGQYQRLDKFLKDNPNADSTTIEQEKIHIFCNIPKHQIKNIVRKDYDYLIEQIDNALKRSAPFQPIFKINDTEFGFIPNLDKITTGEFIDLQNFNFDDIENLHNLMAVLFRPVTKKEGGTYEIEIYKASEQYPAIMKDMPLVFCTMAIDFFLNLWNELKPHTLKSLKEQ